MSSSAARHFPGSFLKRASTRTSRIEDTQAVSTEAVLSGASTTIHDHEPSVGPADEVLMERVSGGDREALASLFRRYGRLVRGVALRILRDDSEADDLLQEVFLFIYRKCETFDSSRGSARSWIVQTTYHRAIDRRRHLQSRHFYTRVDLNGAMEVPDPRSNATPDNRSVSALVGRMTVQGLLDTLTQDQRETLTLYFFEGYTFEEIAVKLGQSWGNIRNHYYRGLDKLRKELFPDKLPSHHRYDKK